MHKNLSSYIPNYSMENPNLVADSQDALRAYSRRPWGVSNNNKTNNKTASLLKNNKT